MLRVTSLGLLLLFCFNSYSQDSLIQKNSKLILITDSAKIGKIFSLKDSIPSKNSNLYIRTNSRLPNSGENAAADVEVTPPIVYPSPNSMAMANLISDNIDLYTGIAGVNLPLYNLKCNTIEVPIGLQSNLNAHKVNEIGSSVGLGWSLNAGGAITRVMKSLPDEFTGQICDDFQIPGYGFTKILPETGYLSDFETLGVTLQRQIIEKGSWNTGGFFADKGYDLQPDEFYFHFGNYSGKFIFDQDGNINLIPQANLKITPTYAVINGNNKITGFNIISDDGFIYNFGNYSLNAVEESKLITNCKSITYTYRTFAKNDIDPCYNYGLDWDDYQREYDASTNKEYIKFERYPYVLGDFPPIGGSNTLSYTATNTKSFDLPENNKTITYFSYPSTWYLTSISSPSNNKIDFIYTSNGTLSYLSNRSFSASVPNLREDYKPGIIPRMDFFAPLDGLTPIRDENRRMYKLPVNHFFAVNTSTIDVTSKKLSSILTSEGNSIVFYFANPRPDLPGDNRLDYFDVINNQQAYVKTIKFSYEAQYNPEDNEKFKFSYNRTNYNYSLVNGFYNFKCTSGLYTQEYRESEFAVPDYCRYRLFLKSVQEYNGYNAALPAYLIEYDNSEILPYRTSTEQDYFGFANENPSRHPFVEMLYHNSWNNTISPESTHPIVFFQTTNGGGETPGWPNSGQHGNKDHSEVKMKAGTIKKITYPTGGFKEYVYEFNGIAQAWNGLRIKEIKEFESVSATPIIKDYFYGTFIQNDFPKINYGLSEAFYVSVDGYVVIDSKRIFFNSQRVNPESLTKGAVGGYTYGEVSQPGNGKQRTSFYTAIDKPDYNNQTHKVTDCSEIIGIVYMGEGLNFPFPEKNQFDWMRGLPKTEEIISETGLPVKTTTYEYDFDDLNTYGKKEIMGISAARYRMPGSFLCEGYPAIAWNWALYGKYIHTSKWYTTVLKSEKIYDQLGVNYLENKTKYTYYKYTKNNQGYLYPRTIADLKNGHDNNIIATKIKYPLDYDELSSLPLSTDEFVLGIRNLIASNVFNTPIEKNTYSFNPNTSETKYLSGVLNKFHSNLILPKEVYKLKTNGQLSSIANSSIIGAAFNYDINYQAEIKYAKYDVNGHLLQQNKTNDISEAYIWDYKNMYPVCKVTNAGHKEIAYTSFESDGFGNWTFSPEDIREGGFSGKNSLLLESSSHTVRNVFQLDDGKKYIVSFWSKNHAPTVQKVTAGDILQTITYSSLPAKKIVGDWRYDEIVISAATGVKISGATNGTFLDELRLYPSDAFMNTYTFDPLIGMTGEIDPAGKQTYYQYDKLNRLSFILNQNKDIVKTICYNYANRPVQCAATICPVPVITSATINSSFLMTVHFTVPPGTTSCVLKITDTLLGTVITSDGGCVSPQTFTFDHGHHFKVEVKAFLPDCPDGVSSVPVLL